MDRVYALYRITQGPEGPQALIEALRSATASVAEPGCRSSRILQEVDATGELLLVEEWEKSEDLERHIRSAVLRRR